MLKKYGLRIIGLLILIWVLSQVDIYQTKHILLKSHLASTGWALLLISLSVSSKILRYQYILTQQRIKISFFKTAHISLGALYLSFVTPGRVGEISKAYFINKLYGGSLSRLVAGSIFNRFFDIYMLLITSLFGFAVLSPVDVDPVIMITTILICGALPFLFLSNVVRTKFADMLSRIQKKISNSDTWHEHVHSFFSEIDCLLNRRVIVGFVITFIAYMFFFNSCYFMSLSLGIPLSFFKITIFIAFANILSFLPISFAGIGTREACLVYLFSMENLPSESALAFSTLVFSFTYLVFGIIGFFCFMTLKEKNISDLGDNKVI